MTETRDFQLQTTQMLKASCLFSFKSILLRTSGKCQSIKWTACMLNFIYIVQSKWYLWLKISVQGPFKWEWGHRRLQNNPLDHQITLKGHQTWNQQHYGFKSPGSKTVEQYKSSFFGRQTKQTKNGCWQKKAGRHWSMLTLIAVSLAVGSATGAASHTRQKCF